MTKYIVLAIPATEENSDRLQLILPKLLNTFGNVSLKYTDKA
jgi:hypothetical protein